MKYTFITGGHFLGSGGSQLIFFQGRTYYVKHGGGKFKTQK